MGYAAQGDENAHLGGGSQFFGQKMVAGADFLWQRFVLRRQAFHGIGDATVQEPQRIILRDGGGLAGKSVTVQGVVEQDAGVVAREGAARPVCAVHAGGKTDDEQGCLWITKRGNGTGMVVRILASHIGQKTHQPGTIRAGFGVCGRGGRAG